MTVPLSPEHLFSIGALSVTNTVLTGWIVTALLLALAFVLRKPTAGMPGPLQNFAEAIIETMLGFADQVTGSREKSRRFLPFVGTLFVFILTANWFGQIPGVGAIGLHHIVHGETELIPLLRPVTSDLNTTLAMAVFSVIASHLVGIGDLGFFRHWGKFFPFAGIGKAFVLLAKKGIKEGSIALLTAVINVFVGLIELVSEVAKLVSLSLRLFGNIFAGEVLIGVIVSLVSFAVPVPFLLLEFVVGIVQALVFSMLTLVYLTIASDEPHGDEHEEHAVQPDHQAAHA